MKTKKVILGLLVIAAMCFLTACSGKKDATFSGSKTGDSDRFDISFDILNTTYTHDFEMEQGEKIHVHIEKKAGTIRVTVLDNQEILLYDGNGEVASDFNVEIPENGTYTVSVSGQKAEGRVTFTRE